ncbi:MAG: hypothetical protein ACTSRG_25450 [Candidatus Helarchaeota archaeon]
MCLSKIREFFWPLLEPQKLEETEKIIKSENILLRQSKNLKVALDLALKNYDEENERGKTVESKSIIFIGTISLITTILMTIYKDIFLKDITKYDVKLIFFIAVVVIYIIYLTRTLWFSVKCLGRKAYHTINYSLYNRSDKEYLTEIVAEIATIIEKNHKVINEKVDDMVMAQEYFKRAIVLLAISPILYLIFTLI